MNSINGHILEEIEGCEELQNFATSNNMLERDLPSSMGSLKSLKILNLANNSLSGSIPTALSHLPNKINSSC